MDENEQKQTKQKIFTIKNLIKRFDSTNKQNIEKQLQWIRKFIHDQLQANETWYYTFGEKF